MFNRSNTITAFLLSLALSGCSGPQDTSSAAGPGAEASAAETEAEDSLQSASMSSIDNSGWLTIGADGAVQTTFFDVSGRYRDLRNGEPFAEGTWKLLPDGQVCFQPDSGRGNCWKTEAPDRDGIATFTNTDGKMIRVRRVSYRPPVEEESDPDGDAPPDGDAELGTESGEDTDS